jgi:hypothetical protein
MSNTDATNAGDGETGEGGRVPALSSFFFTACVVFAAFVWLVLSFVFPR